MSLAERKQKQPRILPGDLVCTEDFPETLGLVTLSSPGTRRNKSGLWYFVSRRRTRLKEQSRI